MGISSSSKQKERLSDSVASASSARHQHSRRAAAHFGLPSLILKILFLTVLKKQVHKSRESRALCFESTALILLGEVYHCLMGTTHVSSCLSLLSGCTGKVESGFSPSSLKRSTLLYTQGIACLFSPLRKHCHHSGLEHDMLV